MMDLKKGIKKAYREPVKNGKLLVYVLHLKKPLAPKLGAHKNFSMNLYQDSVRAPTAEEMDTNRRHYPDASAPYLSRVHNSELYRAYSSLTDLTMIS